MADGQIVIEVKLDDSDLDSLESKANNAGQSITKGFGSGIKEIASAIGLTKALSAAWNLVKSSVGSAMNRMDTMEQFNRTMTAMTGSSEKAAAALSTVKETVTGTAYGLDVAAKSTQNFVTSGMDLDKATQQVGIWADAVSFYGDGTNATFESVTDAIAKMVAQGKVQGDQLDRLTDAGIPAVQMFADATGQSFSDVREALSKGTITTDEFLTVLEQCMRDGTTNFAAIAGSAKKAGASWTGTIDNMKAAVTRGMVSIMTAIDKTLQDNGLPTMREMIANIGKTFEKSMNQAAQAIPKATAKIKQMLPAISAVIAAWSGFKLATILAPSISALSSFLSLVSGGSRPISALMTVLSGGSEALATFANTALAAGGGVTGLGTALAAAIPLWPTVAAGVAGASLAMIAWVKDLNDTAIASDPVLSMNRDLNESYAALSQTLDDNAQVRQQAIDDTRTSGYESQVLADKIAELSSVENKNSTQKAQLKQMVEELNAQIPGLNANYDEEADKLSITTEEMYKLVDAHKALMLAQAYQEQAKSVLQDQVQVTMELDDATANYKQTQQAVASQQAEVNRLQQEMNSATGEHKKAAEDAYNSAVIKLNEYQQAENNAKTKVEELIEKEKELEGEYDKLMGKAEDYKNAANLDDLIAEYEKAGQKIPEGIKKGVEEGIYKCPVSQEELAKLVQYDQLLTDASEKGVEVPERISQGMADGSMSITEAAQALAEYMDFQAAVQKAEEAGVKIPEELASRVAAGSTSVETGIQAINNIVNGKMEEMVATCNEKGIQIPTDLAQGISDGSIAPEEACAALKELILAGLDMEEEAATKGGGVSTGMGSGIQAKLSNPIDSAAVLKSAVTDKLNETDGTPAGEKAGTSFGSGIQSTQGTVNSAAASIKRGAETNISGGETSTRTSGTKAGTGYQSGLQSTSGAINSAARALKTAAENSIKGAESSTKTSGTSAGTGYKEGIKSKQSEVDAAAKSLKTGAENNVTGGYSGFNSAGLSMASGLAAGINSGASAAISAAASMAARALAAAKAALAIKSPSRKFKYEVGEMMDEGAAEGVASGMPKMVRRVNRTYRKFFDEVKSGFEDYTKTGLLTSYKDSSLSGAAVQASGPVTNFYQTINNPEHESPRQNALEAQQMLRRSKWA